ARVHQLFPALEVIRPVAVTGVLAIGLSLVDRVSARRISAFRIPATRYLLALVGWMALSVPGALWPGGAVATFIDFVKTALIFLVIVTSARSVRDVEPVEWVARRLPRATDRRCLLPAALHDRQRIVALVCCRCGGGTPHGGGGRHLLDPHQYGSSPYRRLQLDQRGGTNPDLATRRRLHDRAPRARCRRWKFSQ